MTPLAEMLLPPLMNDAVFFFFSIAAAAVAGAGLQTQQPVHCGLCHLHGGDAAGAEVLDV